MFLVLLAIFCLFITSTIWWFIKYIRYERYLKNIPGPKSLPLFGNALLFRSTSELLSIFLGLREDYGKIVKLRMAFRNPCLVITDVKLIEYILSSTTLIDKSQKYKVLHKWLGTGLLTSTGQKWRKRRRMLTPAFYFSILEKFIPIFNSFSEELLQKLETEVEKDSFDVYPYISLYSLDVICATSLGTKVHAQKQLNSNYVSNVLKICKIILENMLSPIKSNYLLYPFTRDYYREKKMLKILQGYTKSVISSRKAEMEKLFDGATADDDVGIKKKWSFLDLMLQNKMLKNDITEEEIREEVDTFTFEGHDTTSSGISFTLYCIANHLDVQNKVVDELKSIFDDDKSRPATYADLQSMNYLEMVIKESLRLYPPVPIFERNVHTDVEYDDLTLPKGLTLSIFVFGLHRSAEIYTDPERFDPERFDIENQRKRSPFAFIPFSAGSRNCIGQKFAMLEMKSVISTILRNYELLPSTPPSAPQLLGNLVMKSATGIHICIRKR